MQVYGVGFAMGQEFFRKLDFVKNESLEKKITIFCATNLFFSVLETFLQVYGVGFAMGQEFFRKLDFVKNESLEKKNNHFLCNKSIFFSFGDVANFPNACAIQTNLCTKEWLTKNCSSEYGLLAKRIRR